MARHAIGRRRQTGASFPSTIVRNYTPYSAAGPSVWVGGANGALFHSIDDGIEWQPVIVATGDGRLTATITRIETRDENWVKLTTPSGAWLSTDGGAHCAANRFA